MRKAITVLAMFIITIGFGTFELISVQKALDNIEKDIIQLNTQYERSEDNIKQFHDQIVNIRNDWEYKEKWLSYLFNHRDLSTISDSINRLETYTKNNDFDNAICELSLLQEYTSETHHIMGFNIKNIL